MKKLITGIILFALGLALVAALSIKIDGEEIVAGISGFAVRGFLVVLGLSFVGHLLASWRLQFVLRSEGFRTSFWRVFWITMAGYAFSYTTPLVYLGGEGIKAYMLKKDYEVSWRKGASVLIVDRILEITTAFVVVVFSVGAFVAYSGIEGLPRFLMTAIFTVSAVVLAGVFFYSKAFRNKPVLEPALRFFSFHRTKAGKVVTRAEKDVVKFFHRRDKYMWYGWVLSAVKQAVLFARNIALLFYLGKGITFAASLVSLGALYVGYTFPVPAALGVQEAFQGGLFAAFGFKAGEGLALSFVLRAADVAFVAVGIFVLMRQGLSMITSGAAYMLKLNGNGNLTNDQ